MPEDFPKNIDGKFTNKRSRSNNNAEVKFPLNIDGNYTNKKSKVKLDDLNNFPSNIDGINTNKQYMSRSENDDEELLLFPKNIDDISTKKSSAIENVTDINDNFKTNIDGKSTQKRTRSGFININKSQNSDNISTRKSTTNNSNSVKNFEKNADGLSTKSSHRISNNIDNFDVSRNIDGLSTKSDHSISQNNTDNFEKNADGLSTKSSHRISNNTDNFEKNADGLSTKSSHNISNSEKNFEKNADGLSTKSKHKGSGYSKSTKDWKLNLDRDSTQKSRPNKINLEPATKDSDRLNSALKSNSSGANDVDSLVEQTKRDHGFYKNIDLYDNMYWWGYFNMRSHLTNTLEYVFFTKPDLHLTCTESDTNDKEIFTGKGDLISPLLNIPYFQFIRDNYPRLLMELQSGHVSNKTKDPVFSNLLFNQLLSNIEVPSIEAEAIESASNRYGVSLSYRSTSESSNDNFDFSLEFKDTKWLDVYHFFKVYEEYETLKHHGVIQPELKYIEQRMIHDELSIYKFLIDTDASTIIYWCKYYGVIPKSLPRDTFSTSSFDSGLSYNINFRASFFEDMTPEILVDFNSLFKKSLPNDYTVKDNELTASGRDNFHTNINYNPVHYAQVKYIGREYSGKDYIPYKKESGETIGRYVLEFY